MFDAVPPSTCESTLTVTSVSGMLWNVASGRVPAAQVARADRLHREVPPTLWYPAGTVSVTGVAANELLTTRLPTQA